MFPPAVQACLVLMGGCAMQWMRAVSSAASLVNRLFQFSSELHITLIQIKRDSSSAKAQLRPLHVLFPGSSCGGCLSAQQAPFSCQSALPMSSFLYLFLSHTLCNPNNFLSSDHRVPSEIKEGLGLPLPGDPPIYVKYFLYSEFFFFLTSVVFMHNSLCGDYFLCQFGNYSQRLTLLPYYCPCCSKAY